jgi:hypothetical protein
MSELTTASVKFPVDPVTRTFLFARIARAPSAATLRAFSSSCGHRVSLNVPIQPASRLSSGALLQHASNSLPNAFSA